MIIMMIREIPPPKLPINIGLDQIDEVTVGVYVLGAGLGTKGVTVDGVITLIGGTVGGTLGVLTEEVLEGGIKVGVGVTDGGGGGVEIVAAGARGGLYAIS